MNPYAFELEPHRQGTAQLREGDEEKKKSAFENNINILPFSNLNAFSGLVVYCAVTL